MAQLLLLVWKNFVQQKRKPVTTVLQVLFPVIFMVVMALLRTTSKDTEQCTGGPSDSFPCEWPAYSVTNATEPLVAIVAETFHLNKTDFPPPLRNYTMFVGFSPSNSFTDAAAASAQRFIEDKIPDQWRAFLVLQFVGFPSEERMVDVIMDEANKGGDHQYFAAIVFDPNISNTSKNMSFSIRMDSDPRVHTPASDSDQQQGGRKNWLTDLTFPLFIRQGPRAAGENIAFSSYGGQPHYYLNMFLNLQHAMSLGLIHTLSKGAVAPKSLPDVQMRRFPYPKYLENTFIAAVQFGLPLLVFLAYILTALVLVSDIVREKERRLKVRQ